MATIDLGKIKLVWRGTYAGGTAYTVDDVVQHTDSGLTSSFICTTNSTGNAPSTGGSVHGSWAYLAKGSGDATLTTQGDVLYYGGSGLARLGAGTSGQFLKTQGSGANPVWATADSGKTLGITQYSSSTRTSMPNQDTYNFWDTNYTQIKAGSKLIIDVNLCGYQNNNGGVNFDFEYDGTTHSGFGVYAYTAHAQPHTFSYRRMVDGASSTGAKNFKFQYDHATSTGSPWVIWNPNASDDNRLQQTVSTLIITEVDF